MIANKTILHMMHFASAIFLIFTILNSISIVHSMYDQAEEDISFAQENEETFCTNDAICEEDKNSIISKKNKDICTFSFENLLYKDFEELIPAHYFFNVTYNRYLLAMTIGAFLNNSNLAIIGII